MVTGVQAYWLNRQRRKKRRGGLDPRIEFTLETIYEDADVGDLWGYLTTDNTPADWGTSTYSIEADDDGVAQVDGDRLEVGGALDYDTATEHFVTVKDTPSGPYGPITRVLRLTLLNVLEVTLNALTLSDTSAVPGEAWSATITGKTSGSTITASSSDGAILTVVGTTVSGTFTSEGAPDVTLHETHPDAAPRDSVVGVTVAAVTAGAPGAYTDPMWTVVNTGVGNQVRLTIGGLPDLNGNTQIGTQYRFNSGTIHTAAMAGLIDILVTDAVELVDDVEVTVEIRMLTAEYAWPTDEDGWSDVKSVTPSVVTAGLTYELAGWINNDGVGGATSTASLDLGTAAADRFVLACIMNNGYPALVSAPLGLPEIDDGDAWGRRGFYGNFVTTGSGSATMTVETATATDMWCPVFVIRGSTGLVVKDVQIGNPATVTVEAGDLVIAIQLYDSTEPWTNAPTEAAENTYAGVGGGFWKGYAAVFRATAPNAAFAPGVVSGRGERTALIVLGEP